ncbi:hypothetical protein GCM10011506_16420 [Marivirga lumbricoides]|uniref:Peptidase S24/S26A/S26B/S26C domain-containing protein n=1 Tax=Marivirga lumbricoides TaxID=1046115 RepID=A0ABQ1M552_9BACT|nr:hypothetical protein GCM10011506_16420 [Marivirga lumbricoides]
MKETVNQRFNKAVNYLLETKRANNKKQIAESLEVSPSYFTEILKERLKISGDLLQIFLNKWQIDPNFIFGNSDQILGIERYEDMASAKEPFHQYKHQPHESKKFPKADASNSVKIPMVSIEGQQAYLSNHKDSDYIQTLPSYSIPTLSSKLTRAFEVDGNSMAPTITHGDVIFTEWIESLEDIIDDTVYVIVSKKDGILVRRIVDINQELDYILTKADAVINKRQYPDLKLALTDILELWKAKMFLSANFTNPKSLWERITNLEATVENLKKSE